MADITIASPAQIGAVSGRIPRLSLSDALQLQVPELFQNRQFAQEQEALGQQSRALDIQQQGVKLTAEQQAAAQRQGTIGTAVSGVGTLATGALAIPGIREPVLGALGLGGTEGAVGTAATGAEAIAGSAAAGGGAGGATALGGAVGETAGLTATGAAAEAVPATAAEGALFAAGGAEAGAAGATTGAVAAGAGTGLLGNAAGGGLGGVAGGITGHFVRQAIGKGTWGKVGGSMVGGLVGAGAGFVAGGPIGAIVGGVAGALGGAFCPIHSSSYGSNSREVMIARRYRDEALDPVTLRGYYSWGEPVAFRMMEDVAFQTRIREQVVDPLVRYGAQYLSMAYREPLPGDARIAQAWLAYWHQLGQTMPYYVRRNGEVV
jgi:hypothetical protein